MPRPASIIPSYLLHKASGKAYCIIRKADGSKEQIYLGEYGSEESKEAYARVLAGHTPVPPASNPTAPVNTITAPLGPITISELVLKFLDHADRYYRHADGTQTGEANSFRYSLRALRFLYGSLPVDAFGPKCLKAVRDLLVHGYLHPDYGQQEPGARTRINKDCSRIRQMFKWAASEELCSVATWQALATVAGLKQGRCEARESEPVVPVSWADVEKTLKHLNPVVAAMVKFQWFTGCRPGEACSARASEIDRTGEVWLYKPTSHKLSYRGKARTISIGKQGQAALEPFLDREGYLFSPSHAVEIRNAEKRAARKSKVQPSQQNRRKKNPMKKPGEKYDVASYGATIARACRRAGVEVWAPNQLRHSFATRVRQALGLEAAQVALGHAQASVTQVYAERDSALAAKVAEQIG